jgi:hypothetical protein
VLVFSLCIASIPVPAFIKRSGSLVFNPFRAFLTVEEAEALSGALPVDVGSAHGTKRTTTILVSLALTEILLWIGVGVFEAVSGTGGTLPFLFAISWCYAFFRPLIQDITTAPMDLFWLFLLEFSGATALLGGVLFEYGGAAQLNLIVFFSNAILTTSLLFVVLRMPLGVPSRMPLQDDLVGRFFRVIPDSV